MVASKYYKGKWTSLVDDLTEKNYLEKNQSVSLKAMIASPDEENLVVAEELIKLKITDALMEGLNPGQAEAFVKIVQFLRNSEEPHSAVVLKGYAGTGKTYLVKRLIEYIRHTDPNAKIAITAPTNKAVHILFKNSPFSDGSAMFEDSKITENDSVVYCTTHKLLGYKEAISETGKQSFVSVKKEARMSNYKYLFVDEVSMLHDDLYRDLMQHKDKVKIIFLGDPAQIPPINKAECIPLDPNAPEPFLRVHLTQIMRQANDNPIVGMSMWLRENLDKPYPVKLITDLKNDKGIVCINTKTQPGIAKDTLRKLFQSPEYKINSDYIKIIAWRNVSITSLNNTIRNILFNDTAQPYHVGERLIANHPLFESFDEPSRYGSNRIVIIKANTSDEFEVLDVKLETKTCKDYGYMRDNISFTGKFWRLRARDLHNKNHYLDLQIVHEDSAQEYHYFLKDLKAKATRSKDVSHWINYYNAKKWSDDVNYNYAISAHKSQGSTYKNVMIIEQDINMNPKIIERNRIKYTAYTRASEKLYIVT